MMEVALKEASMNFLTARKEERMCAMQRVALQMIAGIDMDKLLGAPDAERTQAQTKLSRLIERERLRGINSHWSYDLNRHIALKQAFDRLGGGHIRRIPAK
ncbi:cytoplasmic protein [Ochrobactrum sp. AN78]|uniref:cytoplasmic protein n=1 Tax=Ochrobactrum sp. AN78 TaxID=3039853 RepID=UPI002989BAEE|nr:cytoplasmic protein [Ochrobactrum sp. AN78]MDH7792922.1 nanoRNase/pAp phosphatase (c-di-AMP/oligoRNAs hydrolase) [Ochrobactrum sp. AN78]